LLVTTLVVFVSFDFGVALVDVLLIASQFHKEEEEVALKIAFVNNLVDKILDEVLCVGIS
jgi:hypothetical protein